PGVRRVAQRILEREGYEVLAAATFDSAMELLDGFPREIHLMVADASIPTAGGAKLVPEALRRRPGMRLLVSGGPPRMPASAGVHPLAKPFTPEGLTLRVREILGGDSTSDRRSGAL